MPVKPSADFARLLRDIERTPIRAINECKTDYQEAEKTSKQKLYETLALAAAFILKLRASKEDREAFAHHRFWKGKDIEPDRAASPILVVRFLMGASTAKGTLYEQARSHAAVIRELLDEGFAPDEMLQRLSECSIHGITFLIRGKRRRAAEGDIPNQKAAEGARAVAKAHRDQPGGSDTRGEREHDDKDDIVAPLEEGGDALGESEGVQEEKGPAPAQPVAKPTKRGDRGQHEAPADPPGTNPGTVIWFDGESYFDLILSVDVGDAVNVTLERIPGGGEWKLFKAVHARRELRPRTNVA